MFENIPKSRLIIYLVTLGLIPMVFISIHYWNEQQTIDQLENSIDRIRQTALFTKEKQQMNYAVMDHFRDADHFYIDKNLETLTFLEPEIESLKKIVNNPNFSGDDMVMKRLELLTSPSNKMLFSEGSVVQYPHFQETVSSLVHPVQVNELDLQNILARIEGVDIGVFSEQPNRPQMIILDFNLDKKVVADKNEGFEINMKVLKREYQ